MRQRVGKRGQLTLFIIIGILIIAAILVFFLYAKPNLSTEGTTRFGFEGCVEDAVETTIDELSRTAGYMQPEFTYPYSGQQYTYLCYTPEYYETCVVQQPFIKQNFEDNLERRIKPLIEQCYSTSLDELKAQGYGVTNGIIKQEVHIEPGTVRVEIDAPTTVGSQSFKKFNVIIQHPIYEMMGIVTSIIQSEAKYGDSEITDYMLLYQDVIVDKWKQSDGTTLYTVQNKLFNSKFQFASRSLAWPPGYLT